MNKYGDRKFYLYQPYIVPSVDEIGSRANVKSEALVVVVILTGYGDLHRFYIASRAR